LVTYDTENFFLMEQLGPGVRTRSVQEWKSLDK